LVVYDAMQRYLFSGGSIALQELEWHLFDVVILLSIAYTLSQNAHVRVDIFHDHFSEKNKALLELVSSLLFILPLSLLLIYLGIDFVMLSYLQNEGSSNPGGLEYRFLVKSLLPLAFALVVLQALKDAYVNFRLWRSL
ncbi:MAG: TRAP transporter small permease subunit, partial [Epsilonproteobacteria bacterium]|nr:TRAP transporter small permease subunit [Campylobacterota bacterium]